MHAVDTMTLEEIFVAEVHEQTGREGRMNYPMVKRLILKDWYFHALGRSPPTLGAGDLALSHGTRRRRRRSTPAASC